MRIILSINSRGECARIDAIANDDEPGFRLGDETLRAIHLLHNEMQSAFFAYSPTVRRFDNDRFVSFTSPVAFKSFCINFYLSSFSTHRKYNLYTHNCSHAAYFALRLAEVPITVSGLSMIRGGDYFTVPIPTVMMTPIRIFDHAKEVKTHEILRKSTAKFELSIAKNALSFWARRQRVESDSLAIINEQLDRRIELYPYHRQEHLTTLSQLTELCFNKLSQEEIEHYKSLSLYYKDRRTVDPRIAWFQELFIIGSALSGYFYSSRGDLTVLNNPVLLMTLISSVMALYGAIYFIIQDSEKMGVGDDVVETEMSQAMAEFVATRRI